MTLSSEHLERIEYMIRAGYGWKKYAESVLSQGWISEKQDETLDKMYCRLRNQQFRAERRKTQVYYNRPSNSRHDYQWEVADYGGNAEQWF